jgi:hypothetical protein
MNCKVWKSCWQNIKYTLYGMIAWFIFALPCWRAVEVIVENSKYIAMDLVEAGIFFKSNLCSMLPTASQECCKVLNQSSSTFSTVPLISLCSTCQREKV